MFLKGKKALITGASRGIGLAIVEVFLKNGAEVYGCSRSQMDETVEKKMQDIATKHGTKVHFFRMDVSDEENVTTTLKAWTDQGIVWDILVNNAGIVQDTLFTIMKTEKWEQVIQTNLNSAFYVTKACLPGMVKNKSGVILNMSSIIGMVGNIGQTNYSASKAALLGFTKSLAKEYGRKSIRVNAIAPGYIQSEMSATVKQEVRDQYLKSIPLGRVGEPEDVANTCLFLASDLASYITGAVINVSGGLLI